MKGRRKFSGGLFPEDRRRTRPVASELRAPDVPESEIRSVILKYLLRSNVIAEVTDSKTVQTMKGPRQLCYPEGWPDISALIPVTGRFWAIECKDLDGKLRPSQEARLPELEASGALITLARDLTDVSTELKRQLALLPRGAFEDYLVRLRHIRSAAAQREYEQELARRARA